MCVIGACDQMIAVSPCDAVAVRWGSRDQWGVRMGDLEVCTGGLSCPSVLS